MSDPMNFGLQWVATIASFIEAVEDLRHMNDRAANEAGLAVGYLAASGRTDIVAADLTAAFAAGNTIIAAFDAGAPPLKAALYKVLK